jgi:hypothetical protein
MDKSSMVTTSALSGSGAHTATLFHYLDSTITTAAA